MAISQNFASKTHCLLMCFVCNASLLVAQDLQTPNTKRADASISLIRESVIAMGGHTPWRNVRGILVSGNVQSQTEREAHPFSWEDHWAGRYKMARDRNISGKQTRFLQDPDVAMKLPSIRYANMIDANTAIYDVLIGDETISDSGDQIAVHLATDSPRPELGPPWRVVIQNPMRVVNGLGVERSIATVSFQGYGTLPTRQEPQNPRHTDTEPETQAAPPSPSEIEQPSNVSQEEQ